MGLITRGQDLNPQMLTVIVPQIILPTMPQHPTSIIELNKLKSDLEEQHRIDSECIKLNLAMQHNRDLQIVKDKAQRIIHVAIIQVEDSEQ